MPATTSRLAAAALTALFGLAPASVVAAAPATSAAPTPSSLAAAGRVPASGTPARIIRSYQGVLKALPVRPRVTNSGYVRKAYGPAWFDVDRNGCNQRQDALWAGLQRTRPASIKVKGTCRHEIYAGTWVDPYSGTTNTLTNAKQPAQAQRVQIDHVVALAEGDRSGAHGWSASKKLAFANDRVNLVASDGKVNQSKGAYDAASWRPKANYQCAYAARVVMVKKKWALAVDPSEKTALSQMLATCATSSIQLGPVPPTERSVAPKPAPKPARDCGPTTARWWNCSMVAALTRAGESHGACPVPA